MGGLLVLKRIKIPTVGCPGFGFDKQLTFKHRKQIIPEHRRVLLSRTKSCVLVVRT